MATATWNGVDIPRVATISERRELIGDSGRAVSGRFLHRHVGSKKVWDLTTTPLIPEEYDALLTMLDNSAWIPGVFWTERLEVAVQARIVPDSFRTRHVPIGMNGNWHKWAQTLTFTVEEV